MLSEPIDIMSPPPPTTKIEDSSTFDIKDSKLPVKSTTSGSTADILEIKCPSCQTSFVGVKRSTLQSKIDRDSPKVYCPVPNCTKTVATTNWKSNLADHFMTHDKSRVKLFVCGFAGCDKSYHRKNLMIDCRRKHKGEWFGCTLCSNQFSSRYERDRHHSTTHRSI
ncbi:hypothetical protein BDR26DRAFT_864139 [Obelidium mucronatum]|nr:hypothetical protein BDR26DRAFT_864139 [Obelidium mucronatum]